MVCLVILFLTSHESVIDVCPKDVAKIPISTISPCVAECMKLISDINFVTQRGFSNCIIAYNAASSSIHCKSLPRIKTD